MKRLNSPFQGDFDAPPQDHVKALGHETLSERHCPDSPEIPDTTETDPFKQQDSEALHLIHGKLISKGRATDSAVTLLGSAPPVLM